MAFCCLDRTANETTTFVILRSPSRNRVQPLPRCILQLFFRRANIVRFALRGRQMFEVMMKRSFNKVSSAVCILLATALGGSLARAQSPAAAPAAPAAASGASAAATAPKSAPFLDLNGAWTGAGQIRLEGGKTERVTCKAYYTPKNEGAGIGIAVRCASTSYSIDLRSNLESINGRVTGSWEERVFNANGNVTGRASNGNVSVAISGGGLSGSMSVSFGGTSQQVSITTSGTALKGVSISLSKG